MSHSSITFNNEIERKQKLFFSIKWLCVCSFFQHIVTKKPEAKEKKIYDSSTSSINKNLRNCFVNSITSPFLFSSDSDELSLNFYQLILLDNV
jgi:hypothetical protein